MDVTLTVESGRPTGSGPARRLRADGRVPAVVYGLDTEPQPVTVAWPELRRAITTDAGLNALITLSIEGEDHLSIVKELQQHPVRRDVLHVDFLLVDRDVTITVDVPIVLTGEAEAVLQEKGMVDQLVHMLSIDARPGDIPNQIELDVSDLEVGSQLRVSDLNLPSGVSANLEDDEPVVQGSLTRMALVSEEEEGEGEEGEEGAEDGEGAEGSDTDDGAESSDD